MPTKVVPFAPCSTVSTDTPPNGTVSTSQDKPKLALHASPKSPMMVTHIAFRPSIKVMKEQEDKKKAEPRAPLPPTPHVRESDSEAGEARACGLYLLFLILFTVNTTMVRGDSSAYFMSRILKDDILTTEWDQSSGGAKDFYDIANAGDVYDFLEHVMVPTFYAEQKDNGAVLPGTERYYYTSAKFLGLRIRQIRVEPGHCNIPPKYLPNITGECYVEFHSDYEDTSPLLGDTGTVYKHLTATETREASFAGKFGNYPGSGVTLDLPHGLANATRDVQLLRTDHWIRESTRAVFIEFQTYNEASDLFMVGRMMVEIPASGGYRPKTYIRCIVIPKLKYSAEYVNLALDIVLFIFILYFLREEIVEMREAGYAYWKSFWNVIDICNICIFMVTYSCRYASFLKFHKLNPLDAYPLYVPLSPLDRLSNVENFATAMNALLLWLKLFKYMTKNPKVMFLVSTISNARVELMYFLLIYSIFLSGFAHGGYVAFSSQMHGFRSISISATTVMSSISGGPYSPLNAMAAELTAWESPMFETTRVFGFVYGFGFSMLVLIVLTNVFLAILNNSYIVVRKRLHMQKQSIGSFGLAGVIPNTGLFQLGNKIKRRASMFVGLSAVQTQSRLENKAAITIQRCWRGKMARNRVKQMREDSRNIRAYLEQSLLETIKLASVLLHAVNEKRVKAVGKSVHA